MYAVALRSQLATINDLLQEATTSIATLRADLAAVRVESARLTRTVEVIGAPDVLRVDLTGQADAAAATGRAYVSRSSGVVFSADGLPQLAAGRTYQVWVVPAGSNAAPIGIGTFGVDAEGRAQIALAMPAVATATAVAVTNEPAGGSLSPTLPILLIGSRS
jgi:anti-sigma-K factor RskA